jgi:transcriptional regulator with XRE-family HTH domain
VNALWNTRTACDPDLGRRLRAARQAAGMTQAVVARQMGRTTSAVCMWEKGQRGMGINDLVAYGSAVHISLAELIGDDPLPAALV